MIDNTSSKNFQKGKFTFQLNLLVLAFKKGKNPSFHSSAMSKIIGQTGLFGFKKKKKKTTP